MINKDLATKGLKCVAGYEPFSIFKFEQNVSIGKCEIMGGSSIGMFSYINSGFVRSNVIIGRYCSIGRNVTIGSGAHDFLAFSTSPFFKINSNKPIIKLANTDKRIRVCINNDVWIGDNAYIMSGINIGNGAVIAAGAIVTKDVEPYSIVAGIPAKHIKYRFAKTVIDNLEHLKWWEIDPKFLIELDIGDVSKCIKYLKRIPQKYRIYKDFLYSQI